MDSHYIIIMQHVNVIYNFFFLYILYLVFIYEEFKFKIREKFTYNFFFTNSKELQFSLTWIISQLPPNTPNSCIVMFEFIHHSLYNKTLPGLVLNPHPIWGCYIPLNLNSVLSVSLGKRYLLQSLLWVRIILSGIWEYNVLCFQ